VAGLCEPGDDSLGSIKQESRIFFDKLTNILSNNILHHGVI
jgi:hypothetical protein